MLDGKAMPVPARKTGGQPGLLGNLDLHKPSFMDGEMDRSEFELLQRLPNEREGARMLVDPVRCNGRRWR
jgi:hypothetical protein